MMLNKKIFSVICLIAFPCIGLTYSYSQSKLNIVSSNSSNLKQSSIKKLTQSKKTKNKGFQSDSIEFDSLTEVLKIYKMQNASMANALSLINKKTQRVDQQLEKYNRTIPLGSVLLGCTLLGFGLVLLSNKKRLNSTIDKLNDISKRNSIIDEELSETKISATKYKEELEKVLDENINLKSELANLNLKPRRVESNFFGQILLSAGLRKSSRDSELGEDTAGFCIDKDRAFFWVLDGTSDSPIISHGRKELISSRLLAQHLSINLQKGITTHYSESHSWLKNAIETTETQWQQMISELPEEAKEYVIEDLAGRADIADVSTTVVVGIINSDGRASIARIGDSKIFCFNKEDKLIENEFTKKPISELNSRLYARATQSKGSIDLNFGKSAENLRLREASFDGVKTILAFSDGIGVITENFLREHFNKFQLEAIQQNITNIPQQTFDDKSLVILQIKE